MQLDVAKIAHFVETPINLAEARIDVTSKIGKLSIIDQNAH